LRKFDPVNLSLNGVGQQYPFDALICTIVHRLAKMIVIEIGSGRFCFGQIVDFSINLYRQIAERPSNLLLTGQLSIFVVTKKIGQNIFDNRIPYLLQIYPALEVFGRWVGNALIHSKCDHASFSAS
jgi:hypothetical protein